MHNISIYCCVSFYQANEQNRLKNLWLLTFLLIATTLLLLVILHIVYCTQLIVFSIKDLNIRLLFYIKLRSYWKLSLIRFVMLQEMFLTNDTLLLWIAERIRDTHMDTLQVKVVAVRTLAPQCVFKFNKGITFFCHDFEKNILL